MLGYKKLPESDSLKSSSLASSAFTLVGQRINLVNVSNESMKSGVVSFCIQK